MNAYIVTLADSQEMTIEADSVTVDSGALKFNRSGREHLVFGAGVWVGWRPAGTDPPTLAGRLGPRRPGPGQHPRPRRIGRLDRGRGRPPGPATETTPATEDPGAPGRRSATPMTDYLIELSDGQEMTVQADATAPGRDEVSQLMLAAIPGELGEA
jgi:hypothetical protein